MNNFDFELLKYFNVYKDYKEREIKSRKRFEKDLFCALAILTGCMILIAVSIIRIENYMKEIMTLLLEIAYAS